MPQPTLDVETYSEAGYDWNPSTNKWQAPPGARVKGLGAVGSVAYAEHPSTEILTLSYDLCDGRGVRRWRPGAPDPLDLWHHVATPGATLESHNAMFERLLWENVLVARHRWPPLPPHVQRCSMATAHVDQYPGALGKLGDVLGLDVAKDADGKRLIDKFCTPRNPTKADPRTRILPESDPRDFERLCAYCDQDVRAEMAAADAMRPMSDAETGVWLIDQEINHRGIAIDRAAVRDCLAILDQVLAQYGAECETLTGGLRPSQVEALRGWLGGRGVHLATLDADAVADALKRTNLPAEARRVLEVRALTGSASVKKLYSMDLQADRADRLRNLIVHHGARTGRPTGEGPQPLNLPKAGPSLVRCVRCERPHRPDAPTCPWCGLVPATSGKGKWSAGMVDDVLEVMAWRSLAMVERFFGDAMLCISGCVRGLFVAAPGHVLMASDYSAIEAVVTAMLSGETWRIDAFRRGDPIYLVGASKITGVPVETYLAHHAEHGEHHPDRQRVGKVSELACGFGGWINSYKAFGSTEDDATIKAQILAWRAASPAIVEMWGGQHRGLPWAHDRTPELYGFEGMAVAAIQWPGESFAYRGIGFCVEADDILVVTLPSGRQLYYHRPRLEPSDRREGEMSISFMTYNSNPKYGQVGWSRMGTYGGRLTENIVQAVAHDILRHALVLLRVAGYPAVLHVYDEIVVEVPDGFGSLAEVERIMATMPSWAADWPIVASGGWVGRRYRKG